MKKSVWTDSANLPEFDKLNKDIKTDVLIIGGGICGVLCAYYLHHAGVDYALVEGKRIGSGITQNTTAKITSQHGLIYAKMLNRFGDELTKMYLQANHQALSEYARLCETIDCDFERKDAYTYSLKDKARIEEEVNAVKKLGFNAEFTQETELPFNVSGAIRFKNQAQFNPLKFLAEITKELNIYENTFVKELIPEMAVTEYGTIKAKKIVAATHFPFINKHGSYFLKLYQHRSYVSAFKNAQNIDGMYVDEDDKGMSFRGYNGFLLLGGGGHRTGKKGGCWEELNSFAKKNYPNATLQYEWATQDCISLDGVPYIGQYSKKTPDMYVATGFNKWGMSSSMVAAMIISDMILGKKNAFVEVFSPSRSILRPQLAINGIETTINLLTPTTKRCPHLGCALKWNKAEHTWDCPCHGSRFQENGELIDNPSTGNVDV